MNEELSKIMNYKEGDRVVGEIYKGNDRITAVNFGGVTKAEAGLQFDVVVAGRPSKLEVSDECRLVTEDGETKVQVTSMKTTGVAPNQATFMMFSLIRD